MKASTKILSAVLMILLITAVFAKAEPNAPGDEQMSGPQGGRGQMDEEFTQKILDDIKAKDPNEAERLERLRQENPRKFRVEIRNLARQQEDMSGQTGRHIQPGGEGNEPRRERRRPDMMQMQGPGNEAGARARDRMHDRLMAMETEFITWLEKNEPEKAKELAALKEKDPQAYMKKLSMEMKKYRQVMEIEATNPALAQVMKKDIELKQQMKDLVEKIKGTADEKQKQELTAQLKDVVSQEFDVSVQKKQLKYEELKKKLEKLQQNVNESQTKLEKFKTEKDEQIQKHIDSLLNQAEQFDWD